MPGPSERKLNERVCPQPPGTGISRMNAAAQPPPPGPPRGPPGETGKNPPPQREKPRFLGWSCGQGKAPPCPTPTLGPPQGNLCPAPHPFGRVLASAARKEVPRVPPPLR